MRKYVSSLFLVLTLSLVWAAPSAAQTDRGVITGTVKDTSGAVSGTITLGSRQLAALPAGRLYVQINSVGAPAPEGNLWGWILFAHEIPGQDVPQQGQGFLPQYDMPKSVEHGSTHPLLRNRNS